jgi:uncharacterized protein (DUF58 family)
VRPAPTRRGKAVLAGSLALVGAGRLLGLTELYMVALAGAFLVVAGLARVSVSRWQLEGRRSVQPERAHLGATVRVSLTLLNRGRRPTPILVATDTVGRGQVSLSVPRLGPGEQAAASYLVSASFRGEHTIGPLWAELRDPFGMAAARSQVAPAGRLVVFPAVEPVSSLPRQLGGEPGPGQEGSPARAGRRGGDHCVLRPYQDGDDLRRVHWASTARRGELMVRQEELPWEQRATVVVDLRRPVHTARTLEKAVSAAASICMATARCPAPVRLVTTDGVDTGFGAGPAHQGLVLQALARARWSSSGSLVGALSRCPVAGGSGTLVLVTTTGLPPLDVRHLAEVGRRFEEAVVLAVRLDRPGAPALAPYPGLSVVSVPVDEPLARWWGAALRAPAGVG